MKALSLHQPWASLIAAGIKRVETRSWATGYRGPLAIHATKGKFGFGSEQAELVRQLHLDEWRRLGHSLARGKHHHGCKDECSVDPELWQNYPLGAIVATCQLVGCIPYEGIEEIRDTVRGGWEEDQGADPFPVLSVHPDEAKLYGDLQPGRFAWLLAEVRQTLNPIPAVGHQGLWRYET